MEARGAILVPKVQSQVVERGGVEIPNFSMQPLFKEGGGIKLIG